MKSPNSTTALLLVALYCCVLSGRAVSVEAEVSSADSSREDSDWYRVELLVFTHNTGSPATAEQWPPSPTLAYPNAARFLIEPLYIATHADLYPEASSEVDEFGRQILTLPAPTQEQPGLPPASNIERRTRPADEPVDSTLENADSSTLSTDSTAANTDSAVEGNDASAQQAVKIELLLPTAFLQLPERLLEYRQEAEKMQARGRYTTLLHRAWLHPMHDKADALPIVLDRSGDTGNWPLLQGSIRLYLSRFLHLETNLWLNTRGEYFPAVWRMPAPPLGPPSVIVEQALPELDNPIFEGESADAAPMAILAGEEVDPAVPRPPLLPVYPFRHAVLLQQSQRLRGADPHYIDHPMIGLIIKLSPLTAEQLHELALQEQTGTLTTDELAVDERDQQALH